MIYITLFLKIKNLSRLFMQSLTHHLCLVLISVQSLIFQFHHWLSIKKQLTLNWDQITQNTKLKSTNIYNLIHNVMFYERMNNADCKIFIPPVLVYK